MQNEMTDMDFARRRVEIQAKLAAARAQYGEMALAAALDDACAAGQHDAQTEVARLEDQLKAIEAAWDTHEAKAKQAAREEVHSRWEADEAEIRRLGNELESMIAAKLDDLLPQVRELADAIPATYGKMHKIVAGHRLDTRKMRPGDMFTSPVRAFNTEVRNEVSEGISAVRQLSRILQLATNLSGAALGAMQQLEPTFEGID